VRGKLGFRLNRID